MGAALTKLDVHLTSQLVKPAGNEIPQAREAHSMVPIDDRRILLFGGGCSSEERGPEQFNDLFLLDTKQWIWSRVNPVGTCPHPRTGQATTTLEDGRVLVIGGCSLTQGYLNDVHVFDMATQNWQRVEASGTPPCPRDKLSLCVNGPDVILFGGFGPGSTVSVEAGDDAEEESNAEGEDDDDGDDEWEEVQEDGNDGETDSSRHEHGEGMSFTWFNDVHILNTETMSWRQVPTTGEQPTPRAAHTVFITEVCSKASGRATAHMVVFGGRDPDGRQNDLYTLDLCTWEWKRRGGTKTGSSSGPSTSQEGELADKENAEKPAPAAKSFHSMAMLPGINAAICYGGVGAQGEHFQGLDVLNTETFEWSTVSDFAGLWPSPRGGAGVVVLSSSQLHAGSREESCGKESCRMIVFGGSSNWEGGEPRYHGDLYSVDLCPLLKVLTEKFVPGPTDKMCPLALDAPGAGA